MTAIQIALETLNREKGELAAEIEMLRAADKVRVTVHEAEIRRLAIECGQAKDEIEGLRADLMIAGGKFAEVMDENERLTAEGKTWHDCYDNERRDNERLRALLLRHQVAAWCEEDSDLAVETRRALENKP